MNKNINQNYLLQIKKTLSKVEKSADAANHFRCIVLMGDTQEEDAYSFIHAAQEDLKNLVLSAMHHSVQFAYAVACAIEQYSDDVDEKESQTQNDTRDEEHPDKEN